MKILYAIQTTGNGHLARAQNIIPRIKEVAELEIITSGPKNDFLLEEKPIKHFTGVTFFYTDNGSVNWLKTIFLNNYFKFFKEVLSCPVKKYDLITCLQIDCRNGHFLYLARTMNIDCFGFNETLKLIDGMFAFSIFDKTKDELILVRDRYGEKPLYFGQINSDFFFSSDLKFLKLSKEFNFT